MVMSAFEEIARYVDAQVRKYRSLEREALRVLVTGTAEAFEKNHEAWAAFARVRHQAEDLLRSVKDLEEKVTRF